MTAQFKVGDRVRITGDARRMLHRRTEGSVGTITENGSHHVHGVTVDGDETGAWWVHADDLEQIDSPADSSFVGDMDVQYVPRGWNIIVNGSDVGVVFVIPASPKDSLGPFLAHLHQDDSHTAVTGSGDTREQAVDAAFKRRAEFDQAILSVAEGIQGKEG